MKKSTAPEHHDTRAPATRRGRPRAGADLRGPLDEWLEGLSPTALHIVHSATELLAGEGYRAFTMEAVAAQACVDRSTLRHHFASKSALLLAVFDNLQVPAWEQLVAQVREIPAGPQRLVAYVRGLGNLIAYPDSARGLFELAAPGLADPMLRQMLADRYQYYRRTTAELLGVDLWSDPTGDQKERKRLETLSTLILAVLDGLSLQLALDSERVDAEATFSALADMIERELTGPPGADATR